MVRISFLISRWELRRSLTFSSLAMMRQRVTILVSNLIVFAGLWAVWTGHDGTQVLSCALLSKAAAPGIVHIHDRMPVVLKPEHFDAWLDPNTPGPDVQEIIADSRNDFDSYPVSTRVNNTRNDFPELLVPLKA